MQFQAWCTKSKAQVRVRNRKVIRITSVSTGARPGSLDCLQGEDSGISHLQTMLSLLCHLRTNMSAKELFLQHHSSFLLGALRVLLRVNPPTCTTPECNCVKHALYSDGLPFVIRIVLPTKSLLSTSNYGCRSVCSSDD